MTDFYKKLYGYEDDIQLKDDDITTLETGMSLRKMNQSKEEFNQRFYRLDLKNNQLVASTKEFRKKEKLYPLISLNEVKIGCGSDNLKSYKLKKMTDKKKADDMESTAFVIIYDNYRKTLDLLAPNEVEQNRWVRVLSYFILLTKKRKGILPEADGIMRDYFELTDTNNDKKVTTNELTAFLDSINLKLKKDQLRSLIKKADSNNDGELSEEEFKVFVYQLYQRREMKQLFKILTTDGRESLINYQPEFMTIDQFKLFIENYQKEKTTHEECRMLIDKYELESDLRNKNQLSLAGFVNYLTHSDQYIMSPEHQNTVYQDMNFPIFDYFVNSSHNTYLSGDQITSESSAECYKAAIMNGARLVEMDVYDGSDNRPKIFHQKTLTSKILFEDALIACRDAAFQLTDLPLIITIELHCSPEQQKVMVYLIQKHCGPYLYTEKFDPNKPYPRLNDLRGKILIRCSKPKKENTTDQNLKSSQYKIKKMSIQNNSEENSDYQDDDENDDSADEFDEDFVEIEELSDLLNIMQNVSFKGIDYAFQNYQKNQTSSLAETKADKLIKKEHAFNIIKYTSSFLVKIYPAFFRQDSSNIDPVNYWNYGFQIAALNFQTEDTPMQLNKALFNDNGNCGFVLKPDILRFPTHYFDPSNLNTMLNKKILQIKVISAQNLPKADQSFTNDITDSYVIIQTYGVKSDINEQKTKTVQDNGFNPIWNEDFRFDINCPELAFIKFKVMDKDTASNDDLIGYYAIRFQNIRCGYRHVKLINSQSKGTLFLGIKIQPFESMYDMISKT